MEAEYSDYNTYSFDRESIYARYIRYIIKRDYAMNVSEEGKKYSEQWQEMTYDTLVIGIKDWYEETDVEYIDFMTSLEELLKDKTEVEIKVDEFKNPEYQFISMYIWNKMLPLRILKN
ncbi:hypothetical protein [Yersinia phage fHe-Yen9-03]|uniref:Phage protein n=1 Tax=Yersinia phage fHe-Yen9-03 TaxID=2052743 RepID=A0A2C9CZ98_9CAUD|nr:hypothetical protein [Yersinia phage fHe-Yen9-03]